MTFLATVLVLALTRAEILQRMRAPVVTQADGFVQVYADCPEDMRREFQSPVARFAADTAERLYRGVKMRPVTFRKPPLIIHLGDVRTNVSDVVTRVTTNDARTVTRLYLKSPAFADLLRLRLEIVKAFFRAVKNVEVSDADALHSYRLADPLFRISDERRKLEEWLVGKGGHDDEYALGLMRRVLQPGVASRRDVLIFASRLYLQPFFIDQPFAGKYDCLSFREALDFAAVDPGIRIVAHFKANEMPVVGGGRGDALKQAAESYAAFLYAFVAGEKTRDELIEMLDKADADLAQAWKEAQ